MKCKCCGKTIGQELHIAHCPREIDGRDEVLTLQQLAKHEKVSMSDAQVVIDRLMRQIERYQHDFTVIADRREAQEQAVIYDVLQLSFDWEK
jgi:hypothetical protein